MDFDQDDQDMRAIATVDGGGDLSELSFEDIVAGMSSGDIAIRSTAELDAEADGSVYLADKNRLVGVRFVITQVKLMDSKYGEGVKVRLVTERNSKLTFTDFSTGIYRQLVEKGQVVTADKPEFNGVIVCANGLVRSDYQGPVGPATTYYLDTQGGSLPAGEL